MLAIAVVIGLGLATSFWVSLGLIAVVFAIWLTDRSKKRKAAEAHRIAIQQATQRRLAREAEEDAARERELVERYGDEIAARVLAGEYYWQGATMDQVEEGLGCAAHVRERVYKSKTKTTWCYHEIGRNRYAVKIHFEDGIVVGWDD